MRIKLDLNEKLLEPSDMPDAKDGMRDSGTKCSQLLAEMLKSSDTGDALKFLNWAIDLYRNGTLDVDDSDFRTIRDFVSSVKNYKAFARGFLLRQLDAAKEAAGKAT